MFAIIVLLLCLPFVSIILALIDLIGLAEISWWISLSPVVLAAIGTLVLFAVCVFSDDHHNEDIEALWEEERKKKEKKRR